MSISIIEYQDPNGEIMVARVPMEGTGDFTMGSQLIVQEGQIAVFYRDGRLTDMFKAGRFTLNTRNLPVITKLMSIPTFGGKTPFRAYIYFLQLKTFTKLGWGTPSPVLFRDSEFKAVHLRSNGSFSLRIGDPNVFLRTIVGSKGMETTYAIEEYVRSIIVSRLAGLIPEILTTILDLPQQYREIASRLKNEVKEDLDQYGLELVDLLVEAITVPPEVQQMIDRAAGSRALDDDELDRYKTVAVSDALRDGSKQPGGSGISDGLGIGAGIVLGKELIGKSEGQAPGQQGPPPLSQASNWYFAEGSDKKGPYGDEAFIVQIENGRVTRETLVWRQGMENWSPAAEVPEIARLFDVTPPPLPPSE